MNLHITTLLFIVFEHINKIFTQGIPISPCPKMFQYRFDGAEWFGILSVRNPDFGQALHLKVVLSMRGKPTTNYLGEIELLTRGQFLADSPVLYKVKFPKTHFPPKLLQVTTNNQVVCFGAADHSIFVTHIQLEHTRKFTFIADEPSGLPGSSASAAPASPERPQKLGPLKDAPLFPSTMGFGTKSLNMGLFEMNPMRSTKDVCGTIDERIRLQIFHDSRSSDASPPGPSPFDFQRLRGSNLEAAGVNEGSGGGGGDGDAIPLITAADGEEPATSKSPSSASSSSLLIDDSSTTIDELPTITRGAWPWLAAIYVNNLTSLAYHCGGTLVSARIVISSAHCFQMFKQRYTSNEVLVFLGRHNLKNWNEENSLAAPVEDIFIHPDYDSNLNTYDADIAVIVLKHEVRFNTFIRPACMWSGSTKSEYIEGELGVVVGWGLDNMNVTAALTRQNTVPKMINAPIVSNAECFHQNAKYASLSSNRTFCAGIVARPTTTASKSGVAHLNKATVHRLQSGPCNGDSGAGLMILRNNRWFLRGTVSASLGLGSEQQRSQGRCNVNQYVVYSDVAKFLDWIFAFII